MNLVMTMAGKYSRFKLFGSRVPKYLLPLGAETMLAEVLKQFKKAAVNYKIYLIANRNDQIFFPIVRSIMERYAISDDSLIYIDETSSQLETALNVSDLLSSDEVQFPIAFANIDTILFSRGTFFEMLTECSAEGGLIDTFKGENKQYSYVRIGDDKKIIDIEDKQVISNNACSGLYGFGSYSLMSKVASELLRENGEANFTDLYKKYIAMGKEIYAHEASNQNQTIVLGTPEEYLINIHRFK